MNELDNRIRIYQAGIQNYGFPGLTQELNRLEVKKQGLLRALNINIAKHGENDPRAITNKNDLQSIAAMQEAVLKMPSMQVKPPAKSPGIPEEIQNVRESRKMAQEILSSSVANRQAVQVQNAAQTDQMVKSFYGSPAEGVKSVPDKILQNYAARGLGAATAQQAIVPAQTAYNNQFANMQKVQGVNSQNAYDQFRLAEDNSQQENVRQSILSAHGDFLKQIQSGNVNQVKGTLEGWANDPNPIRKQYAQKMLGYLGGNV